MRTRTSGEKCGLVFLARCYDTRTDPFSLVVGTGEERYPKGDGIEAISLRAMAAELTELE